MINKNLTDSGSQNFELAEAFFENLFGIWNLESPKCVGVAMKRHPYFQPKKEEAEQLPGEVTSLESAKWSKWLTTEQAAKYLGKFRRKDGTPSVGAIRNMIYRKQLVARKFFGRILINRSELDQLIRLSPLTGGI